MGILKQGRVGSLWIFFTSVINLSCQGYKKQWIFYPLEWMGNWIGTIHQQKEINGLLKWEKSRSISELFSVSESIKNKDISPRNASTKHFLLIHHWNVWAITENKVNSVMVFMVDKFYPRVMFLKNFWTFLIMYFFFSISFRPSWGILRCVTLISN